MKNKILLGLVSFTVVSSVFYTVLTLVAHASSSQTVSKNGVNMAANRAIPAVFGTVTAISGDTITVSENRGFNRGPRTSPNPTPTATPVATIYTVDATNAKITKNNAAGTIASIAVGDTIMVQGTVSGTSVTATMIHDGIMGGRIGKPGQTPVPLPITGNGQPVIAGTISAISGSTLTVTNKSNITYTVDATNAKIVQGQNTITISSISVGDSVVIQGTVNGTSVTASSIIDQHAPTTTATSQPGAKPNQNLGFFGRIGNFFSKLFGF
ncbi:MAG: DUF5666 domain-containing protein [Minisyncoccia bacterium]